MLGDVISFKGMGNAQVSRLHLQAKTYSCKSGLGLYQEAKHPEASGRIVESLWDHLPKGHDLDGGDAHEAERRWANKTLTMGDGWPLESELSREKFV
jgi:hypothetical protein